MSPKICYFSVSVKCTACIYVAKTKTPIDQLHGYHVATDLPHCFTIIMQKAGFLMMWVRPEFFYFRLTDPPDPIF